ncbi:hypothetical protein IAU60_003071 [Kwoniella sp. DSM 27419]
MSQRRQPGDRGSKSPLPLPVHFALLPSMLPSKTLSPVLYVLVNKIPIYLTLDPSRSPQLSLLPLFLALQPISPVNIFTSLYLLPSQYSLTLDGIAPHLDIWVSLSTARKVVHSLGADTLFWDSANPTRGLLAAGVDHAMSWDDGDGIGHNWMPPPSQIPRAAYSLASLSSSSLLGVSVIRDSRYIVTPLDQHIRAEIIRRGGKSDHSHIREGPWGPAWSSLLTLTDGAWKAYLANPSIPTKTSITNKTGGMDDESELLYFLLPSLPTLLNPSQTSLFPFALTDLQKLFDEPTSRSPTAPRRPLHQVMSTALTSIPSLLVPFLPSTRSAEDLTAETNKYRARLKLSLVELLGSIMVSAWVRIREGPSADTDEKDRRGEKKGSFIWIETVPLVPPSSSTWRAPIDMAKDWSEIMILLEQKRAGSPPPEPAHKRKTPVSPLTPNTPARQSDTRCEHASDELPTPPYTPLHFDQDGNGHQAKHSLDLHKEEAAILGRLPPPPSAYSEEDSKNNSHPTDLSVGYPSVRIMRSEVGWDGYKLLGCAVLIGLFLGRFYPL